MSYIVFLGVVFVFLFLGYGRLLFFKDWQEFGEAILFWFKPDVLSALDGEFWEDWGAETKLLVCAALTGLTIGAAHWRFGAALRAFAASLSL